MEDWMNMWVTLLRWLCSRAQLKIASFCTYIGCSSSGVFSHWINSRKINALACLSWMHQSVWVSLCFHSLYALWFGVGLVFEVDWILFCSCLLCGRRADRFCSAVSGRLFSARNGQEFHFQPGTTYNTQHKCSRQVDHFQPARAILLLRSIWIHWRLSVCLFDWARWIRIGHDASMGWQHRIHRRKFLRGFCFRF